MAETNIHSRFIEAKYYDRGDPAGYDYNEGDLTTDGVWRDLDLSSIVPDGARVVVLRIALADDATGSTLSFRKNGNANGYNSGSIRTQAIGVTVDGDIIVSCDSDRVIEYATTNTTFTTIRILVKGWFK